jgi:hypothetical protein
VIRLTDVFALRWRSGAAASKPAARRQNEIRRFADRLIAIENHFRIAHRQSHFAEQVRERHRGDLPGTGAGVPGAFCTGVAVGLPGPGCG